MLAKGYFFLALAAVGAAERRGEAVFDRIGDMAQPAFYGTTAVKFMLHSDDYDINKVNDTIEKQLGKVGTSLMARNYTKEEAADALQRIRVGIADSQGRFGTVAGAIKQLLGLAVAKRFALPLALMGIAGNIVALGSSLFSRQDVIRLGKNQRAMSQRLDRTIGMLSDLRNSFAKYGKGQELAELEARIITRVSRRLEAAADYLEDVEAGWYAALEHRLHPRLVPATKLPKILDAIKREAARRGAQTVLDPRTHLWEFPLSYVLSDQGIVIYIHVPMVRDGSSMLRSLYRLNSAVLGGDGQLHSYEGNDQFIATSNNLQVHTTHHIADLEECDRIGKTYVCTHQAVLHKKPSTCVAALFFGESKMAAATCRKELVGPTLPVVELSENKYLVQGDHTLTVNCGKKRPKIMKVSKGEELITNPGCIWTGPDFILAGNEGDGGHVLKAEHETIDTAVKEKHIDNEVAKAFNEAHHYLGNLPEAIARLPKIVAHTTKEEAEAEFDFQEDDEEEEPGVDWMSIGIVLALVCTGSCLAALPAYWVWGRLRRRTTKGPADREAGRPEAHSLSPQLVGGGGARGRRLIPPTHRRVPGEGQQRPTPQRLRPPLEVPCNLSPPSIPAEAGMEEDRARAAESDGSPAWGPAWGREIKEYTSTSNQACYAEVESAPTGETAARNEPPSTDEGSTETPAGNSLQQ